MFSTVLLFREALYGALVIALACSVLGVYVVLRRIVFVGAALAQISSAGIALALWLAGAGIALGAIGHPTVVSLLLTLVAVLFFAGGDTRPHSARRDDRRHIRRRGRASASFSSPKRRQAKRTTSSSRGNILGITRSDTLVLLAVAVPVLALHLVFYKELLFVSFDRETARTLGYNVRRWDLLLYLTLGRRDRVRDAVRRRDARVQFPRAAGGDRPAALSHHARRVLLVGSVRARRRVSSASRCRSRSTCRRDPRYPPRRASWCCSRGPDGGSSPEAE